MSGGHQAAAGTAATGSPVNLSNKTISDVQSGAIAFAQYQLDSAGQAGQVVQVTPTNYTNEWTKPLAALGSLYEVRATLNSGSLAAGSSATGSYLALTSTRAWSCQRTSLGSQTANLTITIRRISDGVVMATCTVILLAQWT